MSVFAGHLSRPALPLCSPPMSIGVYIAVGIGLGAAIGYAIDNAVGGVTIGIAIGVALYAGSRGLAKRRRP